MNFTYYQTRAQATIDVDYLDKKLVSNTIKEHYFVKEDMPRVMKLLPVLNRQSD
jgi:hypothetical protein